MYMLDHCSERADFHRIRCAFLAIGTNLDVSERLTVDHLQQLVDGTQVPLTFLGVKRVLLSVVVLCVGVRTLV